MECTYSICCIYIYTVYKKRYITIKGFKPSILKKNKTAVSVRFCQWLNSFIQCSYNYCCYDWFDCPPTPPTPSPPTSHRVNLFWTISEVFFVGAVLGSSHCVCSPWPPAHYSLVPFYLLSYRPLKLIVSWGSWICACQFVLLCLLVMHGSSKWLGVTFGSDGSSISVEFSLRSLLYLSPSLSL